MNQAEALAAISAEALAAESRYGPFASTHEGYGVLAEEVAELFEAIRANSLRDSQREAIQVAAVALRISMHCAGGYETAFAVRST